MISQNSSIISWLTPLLLSLQFMSARSLDVWLFRQFDLNIYHFGRLIVLLVWLVTEIDWPCHNHSYLITFIFIFLFCPQQPSCWRSTYTQVPVRTVQCQTPHNGKLANYSILLIKRNNYLQYIGDRYDNTMLIILTMVPSTFVLSLIAKFISSPIPTPPHGRYSAMFIFRIIWLLYKITWTCGA